jgi:hypothetical protein
METAELAAWLCQEEQEALINYLGTKVGLTRVRAECFVRLWIYLTVKAQQKQHPNLQPPLTELLDLATPVSCTHREAATLFYGDKEKGSDRAAGMMLDQLAALGLIEKSFDGNTTNIKINVTSEIIPEKETAKRYPLVIDEFDPRSDAIPVATLLAQNYNWMNRNCETLPHRISRLLRQWSRKYAKGLRVLRRSDTDHPVGFYLLYPTASVSEPMFFDAPSKGLHLSRMASVDPFQIAIPGDPDCCAVFVRSWMIQREYQGKYQIPFLQDAQKTLIRMQQEDFPNLCDLYTLIIHPSYEKLADSLGFQRMSRDPQLSIYWMYQALDRFVALDLSNHSLNKQPLRQNDLLA